VEALLGTKRKCVGGHVVADNDDGTYGVAFDSGHEFAAVDGALLTAEVSKVQELETQLAHLRWRKMQNETKIRSMLDSSRQMHEQDLLKELSLNKTAQRQDWMRGVIEDEMSKPLEVNEAFMHRFENDELKMRETLRANKSRHLTSVKFLQTELSKREETARMRYLALQRKARELNKEAVEIHDKIMSTSHVLQTEYLPRMQQYEDGSSSSSSSSNQQNSSYVVPLDEGDIETVEILYKRIRLLTDAYEKAEDEANRIKARARKAEMDMRAFSKDATLEDIDTCAARVHSSIQELKSSLTDKGMGRSIRRIERKVLAGSKALAATKSKKDFSVR
jgi:CRISPR/Cas system-associated exonuclease Cas4 (RecB family)